MRLTMSGSPKSWANRPRWNGLPSILRGGLNVFPISPPWPWLRSRSILKAWEGLGYYSRARNLQRAAARLLETGKGEIPADYQQLLDLPGIGPYTAAAILSIAFKQPYPLLDANVERLFARLADIDRPLKQGSTKKRLAAMAESLLDREDPRQLQSSPHGTGRPGLHPEKAGMRHLSGADPLPGL